MRKMGEFIELPDHEHRIMRKTKIQSLGSKRWTYGFVMLDSGARYTFISPDIYRKLRLPNLGNIKFQHSDGDEEQGIYTTMVVNINGDKFPINVIVSEKLLKDEVIIGANFMQYYQSHLIFNTTENTVSLKPVKKKRKIWRDM